LKNFFIKVWAKEKKQLHKREVKQALALDYMVILFSKHLANFLKRSCKNTLLTQ